MVGLSPSTFFLLSIDEDEKGLTPELFWAHNVALLSADRSEVSELVAKLVKQPTISNSFSLSNYPPIPISKVSGKLAMCWISDIPLQGTLDGGVEIDCKAPLQTAPNTSTTAYIVLTSSQISHPSLATPRNNNVDWLYIPLHHERKKKGDAPYLFTTILPSSLAFIKSRLLTINPVCVAIPKDDSDARDVGVGIMLVVLQLLFDDHGELLGEASVQLGTLTLLLLLLSVV
jgi:tRNA A64-2'-O-ribosylphosphate transferase